MSLTIVFQNIVIIFQNIVIIFQNIAISRPAAHAPPVFHLAASPSNLSPFPLWVTDNERLIIGIVSILASIE